MTQTCSEMDLGSKSRKSNSGFGIISSKIECVLISGKTNSVDFFSWPKADLGSKIQKTNVGISIHILKIPWVPILRPNWQLWLFRSKFAPKLLLMSEFQKSKFGFRISNSKILCVSIVKTDNFEFIGLNLGNCPITWDILVLLMLQELSEGWNELGGGEWSWVEVSAQFINTQY